MDYQVINYAIEDIIKIVNAYNKRNNYKYEEEMLKNLAIALLGFYLTLGPNIFKMLQNTLEAVDIYRCHDFKEYECVFKSLTKACISSADFSSPFTYLKAIFDDKSKKFVGAKPLIVYPNPEDKDQEITILVHELTHCLEGNNAFVISDNEYTTEISMAFSKMILNKEDGHKFLEDSGLNELVAVIMQNRALFSFVSLDSNKIEYDFVKEYIEFLQNKKCNIARGYTEAYVLLKDFGDNDVFFDLIKKYYLFDNLEDDFKREYESLDSGLNYKRFRICIKSLFDYTQDDINAFYKCAKIIAEESCIFNRATNFEPEKKLLISL